MRDALADDAVALVVGGAADLAIAADTSLEADLVRLPLTSDRLVLICACGHPLAARRTVRWKELHAFPLVAQRPSSGVRQRIQSVYESQGAELRPAFEAEYATTLIGFAASGLGIAVLPESLAPEADTSDVAVRTLVDPEIRRRVYIHQQAARTPSPAAAAFVEICLQRADLVRPRAGRAARTRQSRRAVRASSQVAR